MAKVVCEKCGTTYKYEVVKDMKTCPVCGVSLFAEDDNVGKSETQGEEEHPDWITWYYYRDPKYGDYSLWDKPPLKPEELELIKEFKAPPRDSEGSSERAKEILRTYIPDAFVYEKVKTKYYYYKEAGGTLTDTLSSRFTPLYTFEAVDMEDAERQLKEVMPNSPLINNDSANSDKVRCPYCRSTEIQLVPRKFSLLTGFATNKFDRMCVRCKKRF